MSLQLWDDGGTLLRRLELLGLTGVRRAILHENRTVMVSLARGILRIHKGYVYAGDRTLRAVVTFLSPRVPRDRMRRAERELLAFPAEEFVPSRPAAQRSLDRARSGDAERLRSLAECHHQLNQAHFGGRLAAIAFRLSGRMRIRLGELVLHERGRRPPREIVLSRRHLERDSWEEVRETLLHEMVHQWQAERGLSVDHGPAFREKDREVGAEPAAKRIVKMRRRAARYG